MKHFLLAITSFFSFEAFSQSLEGDRLALVALYNASMTGGYFNDINGWVVPGTPGDSPCGWSGVTCEGGRVTRLDLSSYQVYGTIPPEIGNLTALKYLNLTGGGAEFYPMTGEIPIELGTLTNLESLYLKGNTFSGQNVSVIGNLVNLKNFEITPYWDIPAEFANLVNLEHLFIGSGEAFGPPEIEFPLLVTTLTKLKSLYIPGPFFLKGNLPTEIGNLVNLEVLDLSGNGNLTGNLSTWIGNLTKLKKLYIASTQLTGAIPGELGNLADLEELDLRECNFTGAIPLSFGNLVKLKTLLLGSNKLTGSIPSQLNNLVNLADLDFSYNSLSGVVPNFSGIPVSARVYIGNNRFTFAGIEANISRLDSYNKQALLPMQGNFPIVGSSGQGGILYVEAGGTLANNTYKWYMDNALVETNVGNKYCNTDLWGFGTYKVVVTNSIATALTLTSATYTVTSLPVTLVYFTGKQGSGKNLLTWKTTSETNNSGFEIEKSVDARTFEKIGFVDGNGDTEEDKNYHFTDLQPFDVTYYRLKQLDYDGTFEYSRIISVKRDNSKFSIYPNPAKDHLLVAGLEKEEEMVIRNMKGRILLKQKVLPNQQVTTGSLSNGLYLIQIGGEMKKVLIEQ